MAEKFKPADTAVNPWLALPQAPAFVLESDRPYLDAYNHTLDEGDRLHRITFDLPPEPFLGLHNAPVVILSCNPAYSVGAVEQYEVPGFTEASMANLLTPGGTPIYPLQERFKDTAGGQWWRRRFKGLVGDGTNGYEELASLILSVEFHGYWSPNWNSIAVTLPSQPYGFGLVEAAVEREAVIILTRAKRHWMQAVPSLIGYENLVTTRSQRTAVISKGNLSEGGHAMVMKYLGLAKDGS
jgi:hypothetical protein